MQILKSGCSESPHKISAYQVFYLIIWWCETTEGFIDSHFDVKVSNVFSVAMGFIIFILVGCVLPLLITLHKKKYFMVFHYISSFDFLCHVV